MPVLSKNRKRQIKSGFFSGMGIAVAGMIVAAAWSWMKPKVKDLMPDDNGGSN